MLNVVNVSAADAVALPGIYSGDGGTLANVAKWDLFVNGKRATAYGIAVENGALRLVRHGFFMIVR